jgi:hypothetical protein
MDIWAYLKKESTKDLIMVDMNLVQTALRQQVEYEQAKAKDKAAAETGLGAFLLASSMRSEHERCSRKFEETFEASTFTPVRDSTPICPLRGED